MTRFLLRFAVFIEKLVAALAALWAAGAVYFDFPAPPAIRVVAAIAWLLGIVAAWFFVRPRFRARVAVGLVFFGIMGWWFTISPRQDRDWKPEVAVLAHAVIDGEGVTIYNVRTLTTAPKLISHRATRRVCTI